MKGTPARRNTIRRLRRALEPLYRPTGIVDEREADGRMRLCLFQHVGFGGPAPWGRKDRVGRGPRDIPDRYPDGTKILHYYGFGRDGIVDDICIGITLYPYHALSHRTLLRMEQLVRRMSAQLAKETAK